MIYQNNVVITLFWAHGSIECCLQCLNADDLWQRDPACYQLVNQCHLLLRKLTVIISLIINLLLFDLVLDVLFVGGVG